MLFKCTMKVFNYSSLIDWEIFVEHLFWALPEIQKKKRKKKTNQVWILPQRDS